MTFFVEHLQRSFRLVDAVDIILMALLLYTLFIWFKSTASRPILVGFGVLAVVYLLARALDLYMTTAIFQAVLAFAAIAAIVVFQEDLRRLFIRLASLGTLRRRRAELDNESLDVLVEIVFELSKKRIGALLALQGAEPIARHLRGGVVLDARISKALLDSIFDPHSMGHDGAVILADDRVGQFAVRLPLSENSRVIGSRGTRHSAALGLAEVSDAFVLVVSEERGEVSVAEGGDLSKVDSPVELKQRLDRFIRRVRPKKAPGLRRRLLLEAPGLKATAVLVAFAAWFISTFETATVQKTFVVPIDYRNLHETLDMDDAAPTEARVTLTGFERAFNLLAPSTLRVSLDMSRVEEGQQQIAIDESHIRLPANLSLFRSSPRVVSFGVHKWTRARVPVELQSIGRLPAPLRDRELTLTPDSVQVSIWRSFRSTGAKVYTEPFDLSRMSVTSEARVKLVIPQHMRLEPDQSAEIRIQLEAAKRKNEETHDNSGG